MAYCSEIEPLGTRKDLGTAPDWLGTAYAFLVLTRDRGPAIRLRDSRIKKNREFMLTVETKKTTSLLLKKKALCELKKTNMKVC